MQYFGFDRPSFAFKTFGFGSSEFSHLDLFAGGKQGVWYDPSDKSTLFQDVAGTVPVTKDGDPVGLILDKSQGLELGEQLLSNGSFDNGTSSWINGRPEFFTFTVTNGTATIKSPRAYINAEIRQNVKTIVGETYKLSVSFKLLGGEYIGISAGSTHVLRRDLNVLKTVDIIFTATTTDTLIKLGSHNGNNGWTDTDAEIYDVQVHSLKGNHATQTVSAARPIYKTDGLIHWLEFDGVDDSLTIPAGFFNPLKQQLVIGAYAVLTFSDYGCVLGSTGTFIKLDLGNTNNFFPRSIAYASGGVAVARSSSVVALLEPIVHTTSYNNVTGAFTNSVNRKDLISTTTSGNLVGGKTIAIGRDESLATRSIAMSFYGLVMLSHDGVDKADAEQYLATKSGVTL